jgi:hypothetical protein
MICAQKVRNEKLHHDISQETMQLPLEDKLEFECWFVKAYSRRMLMDAEVVLL